MCHGLWLWHRWMWITLRYHLLPVNIYDWIIELWQESFQGGGGRTVAELIAGWEKKKRGRSFITRIVFIYFVKCNFKKKKKCWTCLLLFNLTKKKHEVSVAVCLDHCHLCRLSPFCNGKIKNKTCYLSPCNYGRNNYGGITVNVTIEKRCKIMQWPLLNLFKRCCVD